MRKNLRLFGINSVKERLAVHPATVMQVYINESSENAYFKKLCKQQGVLFKFVPGYAFDKMFRGINAQGIAADVTPFLYVDYDLFFEQESQPTIVFLDRLTDPQNLGSIVRSLACFGDIVIVLPCHHSVEVTEAVLRVANGGENYVPIAKVSNLSQAIAKAKKHGYWIAASVVGDGENICETTLPVPVGLVVGSEGGGIRDGLLKNVDVKLSLPMSGASISFNAAIATAVLCYEITRQKALQR